MLKKIVFLAITIMVIWTAAAPQAQAQDQASLLKEQQALAKKKNRTPAEDQRILDINIQVMMMNGMSREEAEAMLAKQMGTTPQQRQQQQQQANDARKGFEQGQEQQRQGDLAFQQQQQQEEERQKQERAKAADILREWGFQKVQLPAGTIRAEGGSINIETSNSPAAIKERKNQFQDLKSQIEKIIGKKLVKDERFENGFYGSLGKGKSVTIGFDDISIDIYFSQSAGGK